MRNPSQLRKNLKSLVSVQSPKVYMVLNADSGVDISKIETVLLTLSEIAAERRETVYIIGRYSISKKANLKRFLRNHRFSNLEVEYKTAHSAKGDEADHVIIVDLEAGRYGFPNEMVDDPIVQLVHSKPEQFSHAEERRLFYVALTRARDSVYLIVPRSGQSEFTRELRDSPDGCSYEVSMLGKVASGEEDLCPECNRGHLVDWQGKSDVELHKQCSLYPYCDYRSLELCDVPFCGGYMRKVRGPYGGFWGCTNWRADGTGCCNTKKPDSSELFRKK
jgi:DNA helicase IV